MSIKSYINTEDTGRMMNIEIRYGGTIWRGIIKIKNDLFFYVFKKI